MGEKHIVTDRGDLVDRDRWARLRFAIIGPLLAAPPLKGELQAMLRALSARTWQHPVSGQPIRFGVSTLERWYLTARRAKLDPVTALKTRIRTDAGRSRTLTPKLLEALHAQYRHHPGWSVQLHYDNLQALLGEAEVPSYVTLRRYMASQGLYKQRRVEAAKQFAPREVRSFEVEHVNSCWHLDFHIGSRNVLTAMGTWIKPSALCILDDRSRLICHMQWFLDETVRSLVHGFCQALMRRALPRSLLTDNGAAMMADEFKNGLHTLGILHQTTLPFSPWQNGKQERVWGHLEGRLIAMLEGVSELTLDRLNNATHAWVEREYHQTRHAELGCTPLECYRAGPDVGPKVPPWRSCAKLSAEKSSAPNVGPTAPFRSKGAASRFHRSLPISSTRACGTPAGISPTSIWWTRAAAPSCVRSIPSTKRPTRLASAACASPRRQPRLRRAMRSRLF